MIMNPILTLLVHHNDVFEHCNMIRHKTTFINTKEKVVCMIKMINYFLLLKLFISRWYTLF